mgnify:CR=1 FL=1
MKKTMVFIITVLLLVTGIPVIGAPEKAELAWNTLELNLDTGLENMEYNGVAYVGYKGSDVYYSKDSRTWEKVFSVKGENNSTITFTDVYRVGDGSVFQVQDTTGTCHKSTDGVKWEKSVKEEPVKNPVLIEYKEGIIYSVKDGSIKTYAVTGASPVQRVKVISKKVVLFSSDSQNSSRSVIYYADLGEASKKVRVNGKILSLDVEPQLVNDRMLVPFRAIVEALEGEVSWEDATQTVTAKKDGKVIVLQIDNVMAKVDGVEVKLDVPTKLIGNRTLIPVRFISENLGAKVVWDYLENVAVVDSQEQPTKPTEGGQAPAGGPVIPGPAGGDNGAAAREQQKNQIISKYTAEATALRSESQNRLGALVSQGMSEYLVTPPDQLGALKAKYKALADQLEVEIDARFADIIQRMRAELEAGNFTTEAVQQAQVQYEQAKQEYRNAHK